MSESAAIEKEFPCFLPGEAFEQFAVVDLSSSDGKLYKAVETGRGEFIANRGATAEDVTDAREPVSCTPTNRAGVLLMRAAGAISQYADVQLAGSGRIDDGGSGRRMGKALLAATAAADIVPVLTAGLEGGNAANIIATDDAYTLKSSESGSTITNAGASGAITVALPPAEVGLHFRFYVAVAQELRIDPNGTETVALPSTGAASAAGKYIGADAVGEWVDLICVAAGAWARLGYSGTWTAES